MLFRKVDCILPSLIGMAVYSCDDAQIIADIEDEVVGMEIRSVVWPHADQASVRREALRLARVNGQTEIPVEIDEPTSWTGTGPEALTF